MGRETPKLFLLGCILLRIRFPKEIRRMIIVATEEQFWAFHDQTELLKKERVSLLDPRCNPLGWVSKFYASPDFHTPHARKGFFDCRVGHRACSLVAYGRLNAFAQLLAEVFEARIPEGWVKQFPETEFPGRSPPLFPLGQFVREESARLQRVKRRRLEAVHEIIFSVDAEAEVEEMMDLYE